MKTPLPAINLAEAQRFLDRLELNRRFSIQTFDDNEQRKSPELVKVLHGTLGQHAARLKRLNQAGAGCFVTVNETDLKGRSAANVVRLRAVFVDLDGSSLEPLKECALKPHIIVEVASQLDAARVGIGTWVTAVSSKR